MAFGGFGVVANDLYEWSGSAWILVPSTNRPPRVYNIPTSEVTDYGTAAYDARRDKFVLFGGGMADPFGVIANFQMDIWEWDSTVGWTHPTVTGAPPGYAKMWFDEHRGMMTAVVQQLTAGPAHYIEWDGGSAWRVVTPLSVPPTDRLFGGLPGHDSRRGVTYSNWYRHNPTLVSPVAYVTVNPARFDVYAVGCTGSVGEPTLRLTANWTRAWLGRSLSMELANLPQSAGFLLLGWSNTQAGAISLPFELGSVGMPGCFARVAPDAVHLLAGTNQAATFTLPVPNLSALIGSSFYAQGYAIDPAANLAGLVPGNAVQITVGNL